MASTTQAKIGRRSFLRGAAAAGAAAALPAWLLSACSSSPSAAGAASGKASTVVVKATHGTGLCNMSFFLTKERNLATGVDVQFVVTPTNADIVTMFGSGQVDASLVPYTQFMTLTDKGAPVKIVAGGGIQGCVVMGQAGITSAADMKGKSLGTFQADTLEMLPYDYLKKAGLSFKDVDVRYFGTSPELAQAFMAGSIDTICHIEPYATQCLNSTKGAVKLSDGTNVYGAGYTDCVLAVSDSLLKNNREAVKAIIKGMLVAQSQEEQHRAAAVKATAATYFKTSYAAVLDASSKQPCVVDQRPNEKFMLERAADLKDLGYIKEVPGKEIFDWSPLAEVIEENQSLYKSLQRQQA